MMNILSDKNKVVVAPSSIIFTTFFLLSLYLLFLVRDIVALLFISFLLMVAFNPVVTWLERRLKFSRGASILIVYVLAITFFVSLLSTILPPLSREVPRLVGELYLLVKSLANSDIPLVQQLAAGMNWNMGELGNVVGRVGSSVVAFLSSTVNGLLGFFTIIVFSYFLLLERPLLHKKAIWFTRNPGSLEQVKDFIDSLEFQLGGWVRSQFILMFLIGFITYIVLWLLNIPYALPLAILAGLLEILPNLGPTLAAMIAVPWAFISAGPVIGSITLVFYIVVQSLENYVFVPKILKDNVGINPLVSIVVILIGFKLVGVTGAFLAVPLYIVARAFYGLWYHKKVVAEPVG
jgi:predicted PurR-regulated permease PerM